MNQRKFQDKRAETQGYKRSRQKKKTMLSRVFKAPHHQKEKDKRLYSKINNAEEHRARESEETSSLWIGAECSQIGQRLYEQDVQTPHSRRGVSASCWDSPSIFSQSAAAPQHRWQ